MSIPLKVRGISASKYESGEFAALSLYFPGRKDTDQQVYALLTCEIYWVEGLRANLLIGNNIISPEGFIIDVKKRSVLIGSCGVTIPIDAKQKGPFLTRRLLSSQETVLLPHSEAMVSRVPLLLPNDRDFLFHPGYSGQFDTIYTPRRLQDLKSSGQEQFQSDNSSSPLLQTWPYSRYRLRELFLCQRPLHPWRGCLPTLLAASPQPQHQLLFLAKRLLLKGDTEQRSQGVWRCNGR